MTLAVNIQNLELAYFQEPVLHDLSLQVEQGDFFTIVGPNGSGKTSLIKSICGIQDFQKGSIEILGKNLNKYSRKDLARTLAYVPQGFDQDPPFTVQEMVLMGRSPHLSLLEIEDKRQQQIAEKSMRYAQVEHLAKRRLNQLSGGERQRVLLARALCQEAKIMLLDEPTSSLDLAHQTLVMDLLQDMQKKYNLTIIMVAHDLNLASLYSKRILLLKQGRITCVGQPKEVLTYSNLEKAFDCVLLVDESPLDNLPRITIIPGKYLQKSPGCRTNKNNELS